MSVDPDVAETGQPYAAFGDDPINATDPLGNRLQGVAGQSGEVGPNGVAYCSSGCGSGYVSPPPPTPASIAQFQSNADSPANVATENEAQIAEVNAAAAAYQAAAKAEAWAKFFANPDNAVCDGTSLSGGDGGEPIGGGTCSWQSIVDGGGFVGCVISSGGGSCNDQWNPIGHPVVVQNLIGAGSAWKALILSGLSGCWEGIVATVEAGPGVEIGACVVGGTLEAGLDGYAMKRVTGGY